MRTIRFFIFILGEAGWAAGDAWGAADICELSIGGQMIST
jgi:hypothetical protein